MCVLKRRLWYSQWGPLCSRAFAGAAVWGKPQLKAVSPGQAVLGSSGPKQPCSASFIFHSQPLYHWVIEKTPSWVLHYWLFMIWINLHAVLLMEGKRPLRTTAGEELPLLCCSRPLPTFSRDLGCWAKDQRSERKSADQICHRNFQVKGLPLNGEWWTT